MKRNELKTPACPKMLRIMRCRRARWPDLPRLTRVKAGGTPRRWAGKILFLNLWLPVIFWCGVLFYFSSVPNLKTVENPRWDEIIRSLAHLAFYAILYVLFFRAINFAKKRKVFFRPLVFSFLYGLSDEFHQSFVPTRTLQGRDLLVDFLGGVLGGIGLFYGLPRFSGKVKNWLGQLGVEV